MTTRYKLQSAPRRGVPVLHSGHGMTEALEHFLEHEADRRLVVGHQHAHSLGRVGHRGGSCFGWGVLMGGWASGGGIDSGSSGRSTATRVPCPSADSMRSRPP